jgi:Zn-dependent metalloprotease
MPSFRSRNLLAGPSGLAGLALLAGLGCSGQPQGASPSQHRVPGANDGLQVMAGSPEAPQTLEQLGFHTAQLGASGTPLFLSGAMPAAVRDGETASAAVLHSLRAAYRLAADTTLRTVSVSSDETGRRYIKLAQLHRGVPVDGAEIVVQADSSGAVAAVIGELVPELRLDPSTARLGGADALAQALSTLTKGRSVVHEAPALIIASSDGDSTPRLAYRALVEYLNDEGLQIEEIVVGADDGAVLSRRTHIYHALNRSLYDLGGKCIGLGAALPGTLKRSEGAAASPDRAINDVYDQQASTYWFYQHMFGRDSYDGMAAPYKATVHVQFPSGFSCTPLNAAWLGAPYFQMAYGDGDGKILKDLTLGLDVTAHEITHAVTSTTSNLEYKNESGALNEAMSDILGSTVEAWVADGGSATGNPATLNATADTWLLGKEVAGPMLKGALRFMNDPTKDGQSKDYYPERIMPGGTDNGGVHLNSGMPNLVHTLLTDGGKHPRDKTSVQVQGIGLEKSVRIFYFTNTKLLTAKATFETARYASAQAAETLYGRCSTEWINVHRAWDAVGAPGYWLPCSRPRPF